MILRAKKSLRKKAANLPEGSKFTIAVDTREQKPFKFKGAVRKKLDYGDYQVDGYPQLIVVERKQHIDELCTNFGKHRRRFENELKRMQPCKYKYIIVEDSLFSLETPRFSKMSDRAILAAIVTFELRYGVHFIFADNRRLAKKITYEFLSRAYYEMLKDNG